MATPKQTKELRLDLSRIPTTSQRRAKEDVGEFVRDEILRFVSQGKSPVAGRTFKKLDPDYADEKKGGDRTPNLELDGDMLDALKFELTGSGIEIGIFDGDEADKADGHNNFSGASKLPTRRFIPADNEDFKQQINRGIKEILDGYRDDFDPFSTTNISALTLAQSVIQTDIDIDDIIGGLGGGLFE